MAFWKPGTIAPGSSIDRDTDSAGQDSGGGGAGAVTGRVQQIAISERRNRLPIAKQRDALLYLLEQHPVVVLQSPTGTGKSTQLPQFLLEAGWAKEGKCIAITQPRRVAAISVAQRTAEEVGCILGDEVGYSVRFEALCSPDTKVLYLTDGMLFREILLDPLLSRYSVVMVDEAHERSCYTDLLLGVLKKIRRVRPELRVVISSATIEAQHFVDFFNSQPPPSSVPSSGIKAGEDMLLPSSKKSRWDKKEREEAKLDDAVMVRLEGKAFPVDIAYLEEPTNDVVLKAVETIFDIHLKQPPGDILVFLTGRDDIDRCLQHISDYQHRLPQGAPLIKALPLHSGLSTESQIVVFEPAPPRTRKVIVSTNVAEASVTIDGVKYVVDSGLVKLRSFDPATGMDALVTTACSLASLAQRAGRAGRTSPGKCFRLFPPSALATLLPTTPPEITRSDISLLVLQLKSLGIQNVLRFDWMTSPSSMMLERALEFLYCLGALDDEGKLTKPLGVRMAEMPIDPMMSKILLDSHTFGCSDEILTIAAMTSVQNVFILDEGDSVRGELERRKFTVEEGDHLTALNAYNAFVKYGRKSSKWCHTHRLNFKALSRALSIRTQLSKYLKRFDIPLVSCGEDHTKVRRCLTSGYFRNAAVVQPDGTYRSVREGTVLHAHPSSVLFTRTPPSPYVIYHEVIETTKRFMREITAIEQDWLVELAGHYYSIKETSK
ncbi:P-loop containing nucleoside triphosphate hydrolase protein [Rhodotorula sp. JG-1b]|nr:P-loop containing nucleoside triphosphate hydrolase protein [Rhodotorula sp. JG-1b]